MLSHIGHAVASVGASKGHDAKQFFETQLTQMKDDTIKFGKQAAVSSSKLLSETRTLTDEMRSQTAAYGARQMKSARTAASLIGAKQTEIFDLPDKKLEIAAQKLDSTLNASRTATLNFQPPNQDEFWNALPDDGNIHESETDDFVFTTHERYAHLNGIWEYVGSPGNAVYRLGGAHPIFLRQRNWSHDAHSLPVGKRKSVPMFSWQMVEKSNIAAPHRTARCSDVRAPYHETRRRCARAGCRLGGTRCEDIVLQAGFRNSIGPGHCGDTWCAADEYCGYDGKCYYLDVPDNRSMQGKASKSRNAHIAKILGCASSSAQCERKVCAEGDEIGHEVVCLGKDGSPLSANNAYADGNGRLFPQRELLQSFPTHAVGLAHARWAPACAEMGADARKGSFECVWSRWRQTCSTDCKLFSTHCAMYGCGPAVDGRCTKQLPPVSYRPYAHLDSLRRDFLDTRAQDCGLVDEDVRKAAKDAILLVERTSPDSTAYTVPPMAYRAFL